MFLVDFFDLLINLHCLKIPDVCVYSKTIVFAYILLAFDFG